jgi:hypothetical protein
MLWISVDCNMDTHDERVVDEMDGDQEGVELGADALAGGRAEILREVHQLEGGGGDAWRPSKANPQVWLGWQEFHLVKSEGIQVTQLLHRESLCVLGHWSICAILILKFWIEMSQPRFLKPEFSGSYSRPESSWI